MDIELQSIDDLNDPSVLSMLKSGHEFVMLESGDKIIMTEMTQEFFEKNVSITQTQLTIPDDIISNIDIPKPNIYKPLKPVRFKKKCTLADLRKKRKRERIRKRKNRR